MAREKKSGGRRKPEQDQRRRGKTEAPEPTWHGENLHQPQHATGQTYLERGERKNTWNRDPWGTSWWHDASTIHARFVIRLKGPRHSSHNPLDGLRVQPWIRCTISTSPRNQKRKIPHLESMSCYLIMCKWLRSGCLLKQQEGCCRSLRLCIGCPMKMVRPGKAASCSTHRHRQMRKGKGWGQAQRPAVQHNDIDGWDKEKRPAVHFT